MVRVGGEPKVWAQALHREAATYAGGADRPLRGYAALMAAYVGVVGAGSALVRRRGCHAASPSATSRSWRSLRTS